ncbi:MAG TPA: hypothetical protein VII56_01135 [Rhizomicrobium sp.]
MSNDKPTNWAPTPAQAQQMVHELVRHTGLSVEDADRMLVDVGAPTLSSDPLALAKAQKDRLMNDPAWVSRYLSGDLDASREMTALNVKITSAPRG